MVFQIFYTRMMLVLKSQIEYENTGCEDKLASHGG